jgi:hypothetical protein
MAGAASGPKVTRIISGGQTGVDRAALDVAIRLGIACGGWVPRGRRAEDGPIPSRYPVREMESRAYASRTRRNVCDGDATLILTRGRPTGGTALTVACAAGLGRLHRIVDLEGAPLPADTRAWLCENAVGVLNVAGPRESTSPGIYDEAAAFLQAVLSAQPRRS